MAIPERPILRAAILQHLSDNKMHTQKEIIAYLASEKFRLSDNERNELMRDGKKKKFHNDVRWAMMDLKKADLIIEIKKQEATYRITQEGLQVSIDFPSILPTQFLMKYPKFSAWKNNNQINIVKRAIKKKKGEITFTKGIIVLLDVLGIKGKWSAEKTTKISDNWNTLVTTLKDAIKKEFQVEKLEPTFLTFSDTIMIIVKTEDFETVLMGLASSLRRPFVVSMMINLPLRGCITTGDFYHEETLVIGPAIDEAAEYFELPQWVGISASPSTNREIEKIIKNSSAIKDNFYQCDIPLKNSIEQNAWALNWAEKSNETIVKTSKSLNNNYADTHNIIDDQLKNAKSLDVALKWRNTLKFYECIIQNNSKLMK